MGTVRPFQKGFFVIHNAVFDVMMPNLSANGFKVLCVAIRQTLGWNKERDVISYSQFQKRAGIKSRATVSRAISENLEKGYLVRIERRESTNLGKPSFFYMLNTDLEIDAPGSNSALPPSAKNELEHSSKIELGPSSKNEHTTSHETHQHDDDDNNTYNTLTDFGIDKAVAQKLAKNCTVEQVQGWINFLEGKESIRSRCGFLVSKLRAGEYPPERGEEKKSETFTCSNCFQVRHVSQRCSGCGHCFSCCECEKEIA